MRQWLRSHLTYANVMATVAVFLVLGGGTAVALNGSNTVFSDDIVNGQVQTQDLAAAAATNAKVANGAVNSAKVADNTLTGSDIVESSLGKVPNADKLDGLDSSAFVQEQGAAFIDAGLPNDSGGSCPPALNGWANHNSDNNNHVGYYRDPFGIVYLRGTAFKCGTATNSPFTLPVGYRPANQEYQPVITGLNGVEVLIVFSDGTVHGQGAAGSDVSLDGVTFRCGPSGQNGCP
jgi:hypothetical protein